MQDTKDRYANGWPHLTQDKERGALTPELPAAPEMPAPKKDRSWRKWAVGGVVALVLMGIGGAVGGSNTSSPAAPAQRPATDSAVQQPVQPAVPESSALVAWVATNNPKLMQMAAAFKASDMNQGWTIAHSVEQPIPDAEMDAIWTRYLAELDLAHDAWNSGDMTAVVVHVKVATRIMSELTARVETVTAQVG
jgi:hypothetical protein